MTSVYLRYLIPGLFAQSILQCILKFLQAQSSVIPLIICSFVPLGLHVGITYGLVYHTVLGFKGTALAPSISWWISVIMLGGYVKYSEKLKHTWQGFSIECFRHVLPNLKLAIPSAGMVCLENLAFEILVLMAGSMPDSEISTSLIAICVNTESIAFMAIYGFSAAVSTHVSNELGAGRVDQAKNAMAVTLKLSVLLVVVMILLILFGHHIWASAFTKSHVIKKAFASMAPFLAASVALDSTQGILSGVARGGGWQRWAVWINLGSFCIVGTPIALLLAFKGHLYAKGLWIGLICGLFCQACALLVLTLCASWKKMESSVPSDREDVDNMSSANDATNIELV